MHADGRSAWTLRTSWHVVLAEDHRVTYRGVRVSVSTSAPGVHTASLRVPLTTVKGTTVPAVVVQLRALLPASS